MDDTVTVGIGMTIQTFLLIFALLVFFTGAGFIATNTGASYGVRAAGMTGLAASGQAGVRAASGALNGSNDGGQFTFGDRVVSVSVQGLTRNLPRFFGGQTIQIRGGASARVENFYPGAPKGKYE